jgi:hypothetical protein
VLFIEENFSLRQKKSILFMMIKFIKIIIEISYFPPFLLLLLLSNPKLKSKKYSGF